MGVTKKIFLVKKISLMEYHTILKMCLLKKNICSNKYEK
jgi:hypothetical protein